MGTLSSKGKAAAEEKKVNQMISSGDLMASRIKIKQEHALVMPLGKIQSRLPSATILAYMDFKDEVVLLMMRLNHKTRAYIYRAEGLSGFLISDQIS